LGGGAAGGERRRFFSGFGFCEEPAFPGYLTLAPPNYGNIRLTLVPSKVADAVMPIKWGLFEFGTRETRIKPTLPRVPLSWHQ
jgi:hypothetical protein